jgi:hypothetical protein
VVPAEKPITPEGPLAKSDRETMEILEAFDLTRCAWSAAQLVGCDPRTVAAYVARRDAGVAPFSRLRRPRLVDPFLARVEELVDHSQAKIRADVVHQRLVAMGFAGVERPRSPRHPARLAGAVACVAPRPGSRRPGVGPRARPAARLGEGSQPGAAGDPESAGS